ncbi:MAG: hypothetical protein IJU56_08820 [Clostridia bacterium]|nr:hypothetical protein [Clostridia bacterium]
MLKKLMRYDLQWIIGKVLSYYSAVTLVLALLARLFHALSPQAFFLHLLEKIFAGAFLSCAIAILINALMRSLVCFRRTLYGDPSYLTHTLPIKRGTVFTAKVLAGVVSLLFALLVAALGYSIAVLTRADVWEALKELLHRRTVLNLLLVCAAVVLQLFEMHFSAVLGLVLGHRREKGRIPFSVLFSMLIYIAVSGALTGLLFALSLLKPQAHALLTQSLSTQEMFTMDGMRFLLAADVVLCLLANCGLYLAARHVFCKGVDVE